MDDPISMNAKSQERIVKVLRSLTTELRELNLGSSVPLVSTLGPIEFLRTYVSSNRPVIITSAVSHWPALSAWTEPGYLVWRCSDALVTVALTPNGRADCPTLLEDGSPCFALPHEQRMPLSQFLHMLVTSHRTGAGLVPYMQQQNGSMMAELPHLIDDVAAELPWATEAFGASPEAVNIWIGGRKSKTAWHRDHFENVYVVVTGSKRFRLLPTTDAYRMRLRRYRVARWCPGEGELLSDLPRSLRLQVVLPEQEVLWCSEVPQEERRESRDTSPTSKFIPEADPDEIAAGLLDDPALPPPLEVTLGAGETLYIPAGWWHEVHHDDDLVIAVNYWYDMQYDSKYAYAKAIEQFAMEAGLNETLSS